MNLLLLPGNSPRHKQWLEQVDQQLRPLFERTLRHDYRHWQTGQPEIDLAYEASQLVDASIDLEPFVVFAKSAGTVLCLQAIEQGILNPDACVFTGIPLPIVNTYDLPLTEWLTGANIPITIIQNSHDPYGSYQELRAIVASTKNQHITIQEATGDTHDYLDFDMLYGATQKILSV